MSDKEYLKTGTTTIGIVCKDGVIMAADKRSTAGHMVANKEQTKLYQIADNMMVAQAGLVSDAQLLTKLIKAELKLKEIQTDRKSNVKEAANLLASFSYSNLRRPSMVPGIVAFLLGGADEEGYHLYNLGVDGSVTERSTFDSEGSGSVFALGVLETLYKPNLSAEEGVKLALKAINAALQRDSASGNGVDIFKISEKGVEHVETIKIDTGVKA